MPKRNIHNPVVRSNPNPKKRVTLDTDRMKLLLSIKTAMVSVPEEITPEEVAAEVTGLNRKPVTPAYIRQILRRAAYVSFSRLLDVQSAVDRIIENRKAVA